MLAAVCLELARRGHAVSVVARRRDRLEELARRSAGLQGRIHGVPADYRRSTALRAVLSEAQLNRRPFETALCWIHAVAPEAPYVVAECIQRETETRRYFYIRGTVHANPRAGSSERRARVTRLPGVLYREIALGFVLEGATSRWLTNAEISAGVLEAVDEDAEYSVVGTIEPWDRRPTA